jgi:hypothetical protein
LQGAILEHVEIGSQLMTDEASGYSGIAGLFFARTTAFELLQGCPFLKAGEVFCRGNLCLTGGLERNRYAERMFKYTKTNQIITTAERILLDRWKITSTGIAAAGKKRPETGA